MARTYQENLTKLEATVQQVCISAFFNGDFNQPLNDASIDRLFEQLDQAIVNDFIDVANSEGETWSFIHSLAPLKQEFRKLFKGKKPGPNDIGELQNILERFKRAMAEKESNEVNASLERQAGQEKAAVDKEAAQKDEANKAAAQRAVVATRQKAPAKGEAGEASSTASPKESTPSAKASTKADNKSPFGNFFGSLTDGLKDFTKQVSSSLGENSFFGKLFGSIMEGIFSILPIIKGIFELFTPLIKQFTGLFTGSESNTESSDKADEAPAAPKTTTTPLDSDLSDRLDSTLGQFCDEVAESPNLASPNKSEENPFGNFSPLYAQQTASPSSIMPGDSKRAANEEQGPLSDNSAPNAESSDSRSRRPLFRAPSGMTIEEID